MLWSNKAFKTKPMLPDTYEKFADPESKVFESLCCVFICFQLVCGRRAAHNIS